VGILALFLIYRLVEDPPWANVAKGAGVKIDYIGVALLTIGVAALQVVLDKGQEDDWFGSHFILTLAVIAGVALVALVIWEWFYKDPVIDVRLFRNLNYLGSNLMMFNLGVVLFSSIVLLPQFLQNYLGYEAQSAGLVLSAGGIVLLLMMPVVGILSSKVQARYLISFVGWCSRGPCTTPPSISVCRSASGPPATYAFCRRSAFRFCSCPSRSRCMWECRRKRTTLSPEW